MRESVSAALDAAKAKGFVAADETCEATDAHYSFFESLLTGRSVHSTDLPTDRFRKLFPAQVIKDAAMAHYVNSLVARLPAADRVLVLCGIGHSGYSHGVPERVFAAHPELRDESYSVYAYKVDDEKTVLEEEGLREVFIGSSSADRGAASDVAFCFDDEQ